MDILRQEHKAETVRLAQMAAVAVALVGNKMEQMRLAAPEAVAVVAVLVETVVPEALVVVVLLPYSFGTTEPTETLLIAD